MTEDEKTEEGPGPFLPKQYAQGFSHGSEDVIDDGLEETEKYMNGALRNVSWYTIGYKTAVNAFKEGQAI